MLNAQEFVERQKSYDLSYADLKSMLVPLLTKNVSGFYGLYYEDLQSGAWVGYNEREKFIPQSLFKVPLAMTILKKVERGDLSLDETITLREEDLDPSSGTLYKKGSGHQMQLKDLLKVMIEQSDNTAVPCPCKQIYLL
ncbi:MAG: serine hydrolase [Nanoarchaeota archaeon]